MAPIAFAVSSAILHAAPSHSKRATSATKHHSILIGIIVPVVLCELAIGAVCCFFIWRATRVRKTANRKQTHKLDTKCAQQNPKCEKSTLELCETSTVLEVGVATFRYSHEASRIASPIELPTPTRPEFLARVISELPSTAESGSTEQDRCSTPEHLLGQDWEIEQGWSPIGRVRPSNIITDPPSLESSNTPEVLRIQQPSQACVDPFDVEYHPNPVHFPFSAGPSNKVGELPLQKTYFPNTEWEQVYAHVPPVVESDISDMEMHSRTATPSPDELYMREETSSRNRIFMDVDQEETLRPLSSDPTHGYSDPEVQTQIYRPKSPLEHVMTAVDEISNFSPKFPPVNPNRTITPEPRPHMTPRKRVASRDLRPLKTDSLQIEPSNKHDGMMLQRSNQRRRPNPRTLMPKDSSPQNLKITSSPESSKSTPISAKTDLSCASTVTQAASPGSSAITTPSVGAESPANPFSPQENALVCQTCGQTFHTPGRQKKHYNRQHNLRYVCDICMRPFGVKADLDRHEHTVHADRFRSDKRSWCTIPGCPMPNKEWTRKDNFNRHVRSCEARAATAAAAAAINQGTRKGKERAVVE